jgi:predicted TPR repeat methyltransferase
MSPGSAPALYNRALAFEDLGRHDDAVASYRAAADAAPELFQAWFNLGRLLDGAARRGEAEEAYRKAVAIHPDYHKAWRNLARLLIAQRDERGALAAFRRAAELAPEDAQSRHMIDALTGATADSPDAAYVRELFDDFAPNFDKKLLDELNYTAPSSLVALLTAKTKSLGRVIDLGCGTGLAGEALRPHCEHLSGVDLAPRMVEVARAKDIYDHLVADDLVAAIDAAEAPFDAFVAADVFVYVGALDGCFEAMARKSAAGALVALTTEWLDGSGFKLRRSGRYAHSDVYLEQVATTHGFELLKSEPTSLRTEHGSPVVGRLLLLKRVA